MGLYHDQAAVRKDLMDIQKLQEECTYLQQHGIGDLAAADARMAELSEMERCLKKEGQLKKELQLQEPDSGDRLKLLRDEKRILRRVLKREEENEEIRKRSSLEKEIQKLLGLQEKIGPGKRIPEETDAYTKRDAGRQPD